MHQPDADRSRCSGGVRKGRACRCPTKAGLAITAVAQLLASPALAQRAGIGEGALDLVLPTGARAVAIGQATMGVRSELNTEAVWWNPSALAHLRGTQAAIHHSQSIAGTSDAIAVVANSGAIGSIGLSASLRDFGPTPSVDPEGTELGTVMPRSIVYAATYAASVERVNVGVSYKLVQWRLDCSGPCVGETGVIASTSAVDAGAQLTLDPLLPITVGASVRNVGVRVQVDDEPQSDPLPARVQAGLQWRVAQVSERVDGIELHLSADMVTELRETEPAPRVGAEVALQRRLRLRGGYASRSSGFGGPSLGVGYELGSLAIDFARLFDEVSSGSGSPPTYLSVRYSF